MPKESTFDCHMFFFFPSEETHTHIHTHTFTLCIYLLSIWNLFPIFLFLSWFLLIFFSLLSDGVEYNTQHFRNPLIQPTPCLLLSASTTPLQVQEAKCSKMTSILEYIFVASTLVLFIFDTNQTSNSISGIKLQIIAS